MGRNRLRTRDRFLVAFESGLVAFLYFILAAVFVNTVVKPLTSIPYQHPLLDMLQPSGNSPPLLPPIFYLSTPFLAPALLFPGVFAHLIWPFVALWYVKKNGGFGSILVSRVSVVCQSDRRSKIISILLLWMSAYGGWLVILLAPGLGSVLRGSDADIAINTEPAAKDTEGGRQGDSKRE